MGIHFAYLHDRNFFKAENNSMKMRSVKRLFGYKMLQFCILVHRFKDKLEGYGRITWKRPNTMRGHYFGDLIVAKPVGIHHILRYQMKDMFIIFQMIPHSLILTEQSGHSTKVGWVLAFSRKWQTISSTDDNFPWHLSSKYCHSVKKLLRAIKPIANGHKYPKFS